MSHSLPLESMTVGWMAGLAVDLLTKKMAAGEASLADLDKVMEAIRRPAVESATLPLEQLLTLETPGMPTFAQVEELVGATTTFGDRGIAAIKVPALWTSGWYDNAGGGERFSEMRHSSDSQRARAESRLILGAWTHNYFESFVGEVGLGGFGSSAGGLVPESHLTYYSRHLRGDDVDIPVVRYFVIGPNVWKEADDWPIPGTDSQRWFLHSRGRANSAAGDGALTRDPPTASEPADRYRYDPHHPVPSWGFRVMYTGGSTVSGPYEQTRVERRDDVLVYTSAPLTETVEVVGDVELHLWISTSVPDTDFVAKLCTVAPDDTSVNLADGFLRARLRDGWRDPKLLEPGRGSGARPRARADRVLLRAGLPHPSAGHVERVPAPGAQHEHGKPDRFGRARSDRRSGRPPRHRPSLVCRAPRPTLTHPAQYTLLRCTDAGCRSVSAGCSS